MQNRKYIHDKSKRNNGNYTVNLSLTDKRLPIKRRERFAHQTRDSKNTFDSSYYLISEFNFKDFVEYKPVIDEFENEVITTITEETTVETTTVVYEKSITPKAKSLSKMKMKISDDNKVKLFGNKVKHLPIEKDAIVKFEDLHLSYRRDDSHENKNVIRGITLSVRKGETLAIIGESGSGKSVVTSTVYGLAGDNAVFENGKVIVKGTEVQDFSQKQWEKSKLRGRVVSAVFQNPMTTLNPTMKVGNQIIEGILTNKRAKNKKEAMKMTIEILKDIKIKEPEKIVDMYPHQLSGGMKQRIVIAAIVSCRPEIIVMDEPTTALDPNVQAEVLKIIYDIQKKYDLTIIFISHDLGVVSSIADRIAIMYAGEIIEMGDKEEVMWRSAHPYTWGLLSSMPDINRGHELSTIKGSVPTSLNDVVGDPFAPRNNFAMQIDFEETPPYFQISDSHFVKSWLYDEKAPEVAVPKLILDRWKEGN